MMRYSTASIWLPGISFINLVPTRDRYEQTLMCRDSNSFERVVVGHTIDSPECLLLLHTLITSSSWEQVRHVKGSTLLSSGTQWAISYRELDHDHQHPLLHLVASRRTSSSRSSPPRVFNVGKYIFLRIKKIYTRLRIQRPLI